MSVSLRAIKYNTFWKRIKRRVSARILVSVHCTVKSLPRNVFSSHNSPPIISLSFELNKVISKFNGTIHQSSIVQPFRSTSMCL